MDDICRRNLSTVWLTLSWQSVLELANQDYINRQCQLNGREGDRQKKWGGRCKSDIYIKTQQNRNKPEWDHYLALANHIAKYAQHNAI